MSDDVSHTAPEGTSFTVTPPTTLISIHDQGKLVVAIKPDGCVEYGEGISLDEASKKFWEAVAARRPTCPSCGFNLFP